MQLQSLRTEEIVLSSKLTLYSSCELSFENDRVSEQVHITVFSAHLVRAQRHSPGLCVARASAEAINGVAGSPPEQLVPLPVRPSQLPRNELHGCRY